AAQQMVAGVGLRLREHVARDPRVVQAFHHRGHPLCMEHLPAPAKVADSKEAQAQRENGQAERDDVAGELREIAGQEIEDSAQDAADPAHAASFQSRVTDWKGYLAGSARYFRGSGPGSSMCQGV